MKRLYILVDISLSMTTDKRLLINDINKYIETYPNYNVSVYFFNHVIDEVKHNVKKIKDKDFDFRGRTALWDSIEYVLNKASYDIFPTFVIFTDGRDTASEFTTFDQVYNRIFYKKMMGWNFIFPDRNPFYSRTSLCLEI